MQVLSTPSAAPAEYVNQPFAQSPVKDKTSDQSGVKDKSSNQSPVKNQSSDQSPPLYVNQGVVQSSVKAAEIRNEVPENTDFLEDFLEFDDEIEAELPVMPPSSSLGD